MIWTIVIQITILDSIIPGINFVRLIRIINTVILLCCIISRKVVGARKGQITFWCICIVVDVLILMIHILSYVFKRILMAILAQEILLGSFLRNLVGRRKCVIFSISVNSTFEWNFIHISVNHRLLNLLL